MAVEMFDAGVDRGLRVSGYDFQNRWRTQIRASKHCRDPLERHRAGAYLRVVKHVERRVRGIHKGQMIAQLQHRFGLLPCKVPIRKVVANTDLVPSEIIEEEPQIARAVQIAQGMVLDDQLDTSLSRDWDQNFERPAEAVRQCLHRRRKNRIALSGIDDDALGVPTRREFTGTCNNPARMLAHLRDDRGQIYVEVWLIKRQYLK